MSNTKVSNLLKITIQSDPSGLLLLMNSRCYIDVTTFYLHTQYLSD